MTNPSVDSDDTPEIVQDVAYIVQRYGYADVLAEVQMHAPLRVVPSAPARPGDPETSHAAAKDERDLSRFSEKSRQGRLLRVFGTGPRTDYEATTNVVGGGALPTVYDGCRRRCSDLRAAGFLVDSGVRRCSPASNDESIVWHITLAGQAALRHLDETGWSR